jgi:hypothetical protein
VRCGVLVGTDTVTAQGHSPWTRHARSGDFYLAKNGDLHLATNGDFFMATDTLDVGLPICLLSVFLSRVLSNM